MFKKYIPHPTKREFFAMILLFAELILFSVFVPNFLSVDNIIRVIQNNAEVAIISIGMTIVMLMGGIDLSVGAVMGVVAVVTGTMIEKQMNTILVILVAAGIGTLVGAINGLIIAKLHIPDMLATLATGNIWKAVIFGLLGGKWLTSLKPQFAAVTTGRIFGIPILLLLVIAVYALFYYIFMYRKLGRYIYAIGNNDEGSIVKRNQCKLCKNHVLLHHRCAGRTDWTSIHFPYAKCGDDHRYNNSDPVYRSSNDRRNRSQRKWKSRIRNRNSCRCVLYWIPEKRNCHYGYSVSA